MKYLVAGLESSCTRIVSKLIAYNLDIIKDKEEWNGYDLINDSNNLVVHRSIPHGIENKYIDVSFANEFDYVIISTRDWNCSLISKVERHQHNIIEANIEHVSGLLHIKNIIENHKNVYIFSSESAFLLQHCYTVPFLKSVGIKSPKHIKFSNPNRKYIKELGI
jgi:hypothetical protein